MITKLNVSIKAIVLLHTYFYISFEMHLRCAENDSNKLYLDVNVTKGVLLSKHTKLWFATTEINGNKNNTVFLFIFIMT